MERTSRDYELLLKHTSNLNGEGLYWVPAISILAEVYPGLLDMTYPQPEILPYIHVDGRPGIDFAGALRQHPLSGATENLVKAAWALFNSADFYGRDNPEAAFDAPALVDLAGGSDLRNLNVLLDAIRVRKGPYHLMGYELPRSPAHAAALEAAGISVAFLERRVEEERMQAEHNYAIDRVRSALTNRIEKFIASLTP